MGPTRWNVGTYQSKFGSSEFEYAVARAQPKQRNGRSLHQFVDLSNSQPTRLRNT